MHDAAMGYVRRQTGYRRNICWPYVLEFGSRDVNGSPRKVISCERYVGIDIADGPGVDIVADAADWRPEDPEGADLVVCCETLEHTPRAWELVANAARCLRAGGTFVMTCATHPRHPHSAVDGGSQLRPGEHYANVHPDEALEWCEAAGLKVVHMQTLDLPFHGGDLYLTAVKA